MSADSCGFNRALAKLQALTRVQSFKKEHHDPVVGNAAVAREASGSARAMPGTNNAFVQFSNIQKTYDGETLVVRISTWRSPG
ncbi:hypothetical protein [Bradyrhizobium sp. LMG 9283]|uniref:hypothetical protein n=1 Tax=Bradyrhizobium sp. LMG 9283 TaxID=592064 RepID=UPI00388F3DE4